MAVQHRWSAQLVCVDAEGLVNAVTEVRWRLSSIDTTRGEGADCTENSLYGVLSFGPPDAETPTGDEVTPEIIRTWVESSEGAPVGGYEAQNEAILAGMLAEPAVKVFNV
jgi:hypothetical protein